MNHYVYILYSASKDRYYIGYSGNLKDRISRHNAGRSKSTKSGRPWVVVYLRAYENAGQAYQGEQAIKKRKSRAFLAQLISDYEYSPYPLPGN